ncbi:MAG TPA: hypothetical protein VLH56_18690 [Dissulfurispiraceae bacterium]|nr:hypothetical protein [Dissulfurispiraceae bacterium]
MPSDKDLEEAIERFEKSEKWSLYKDHEKRAIAFRAGWEEAVRKERERCTQKIFELPKYRATVYESMWHGVACDVVRVSDLSAVLTPESATEKED